jgi:hypothetical protein
MEYSLKLNGKQDALWIKNLLISKNPKVSYRKNANNDEFDLGNGLKITLYDNHFPPNHPVASYETMFQEEDFIYEQTISYELKNNQQYEICYKMMYEISFAILESLHVNGIFYHTSGEEMFFYAEGTYTFNITYLELLRTNYEELLEHIEYENFMGS